MKKEYSLMTKQRTSKCFDICEKQNADIYALALRIINSLNNGK